LAEARRYLDAKYELGWRVAMMVPQVGTRKVVFLFEKVSASKKPVDSK
jgi:hypothetical protein